MFPDINNNWLWIQVFAIPVILGIVLLIKFFLNRHNGHQIYLLASIFTLKPMVATPIWFWIFWMTASPNIFTRALYLSISILPGAGLTALIVLTFRSLFLDPTTKVPRWLLIFDCIRWLNSFLLLASLVMGTATADNGFLLCVLPTGYAGLFIPSIYAIFALIITRGSTTQTQSEAIT